jgi:hypothetical protein
MTTDIIKPGKFAGFFASTNHQKLKIQTTLKKQPKP